MLRFLGKTVLEVIYSYIRPSYIRFPVYLLRGLHSKFLWNRQKAFEEATGKKIPYEVVERRTGDIDSLYATTKLVESELGWQAKFSMKDICELTLNNFAEKAVSNTNYHAHTWMYKSIHFTLYSLHASRFQVRICGRGSRRTRRATILMWRTSDWSTPTNATW